MSIDCHRSPGRVADHLGDERDPRHSTDEQDLRSIPSKSIPALLTARRALRPSRPRRGRIVAFSSYSHVTRTWSAGRAAPARSCCRCRSRALPSPGARSSRNRTINARAAGSEAPASVTMPSTACGRDVHEQRLVDVDAAEALHALRVAEQREPAVTGVVLAHDGHVERAPAKVVDGDDLPGRHTLRTRVRTAAASGSVGSVALARSRHANRLLEEAKLVGAVVGRMGDHDRVRRSARSPRSRAHDRPQVQRHERLCAVQLRTDDDRRRVAESPLELARRSGGLSDRPTLGRVAGRISPSSRTTTTEGMVAARSPSWKISTRPSRAVAAAE